MLLAFTAGAGLWLLNHRYFGIWHDARVYTLMAVHWLNPQPFAADPWISTGSVDGLSIFAPIYGMAMRLMGIADAAKFMVLAGGLTWLGATFWLCRVWFGRRLAIFIFFALASAPLTYCLGLPILLLSESFATSRLFAIPLTIAGLVAVVEGRIRLGVGFQLMGILFHPLIAIWGLLATIVVKASDRAVLVLMALAAAVLGAMLLNPMDIPSLRVMEPEWFAVVKATAVIVVQDHWPKLAINDALWWFAALLFAGNFGQPKVRRLYLAVCLISASALLVSLIVSYFVPIVFLLQVQTWRALWLAVLFGLIAALDIGWAAARSGAVGKGIVGLLLATFLLRSWGGGLALFLAYCVWTIYSRQWSVLVANRAPMMTRIAWILVAGAMACRLPDLLMDIWILADMERHSMLGLLDDMGKDAVAMSFYTAVPFLLWTGFYRIQRSWLHSAVVVSALGMFFIFAVGSWDQRTELRRYVESRYRLGGNQDLFSGLIQPGNQVYWNGQALRVWFDLGTASYASSVQALGIVFSEARMHEVKRRLERVLLKSGEPPTEYPATDDMTLQDARRGGITASGFSPLNLHTYEGSGLITKAGLLYLCQDSQLDFVVDIPSFPGWTVSSFTEHLKSRTITYYLYDCHRLPVTS